MRIGLSAAAAASPRARRGRRQMPRRRCCKPSMALRWLGAERASLATPGVWRTCSSMTSAHGGRLRVPVDSADRRRRGCVCDPPRECARRSPRWRRLHFPQVVHVHLERVQRAAGARAISLVEADALHERVDAVADDQAVVGVAQMAVVVDPVGRDAGAINRYPRHGWLANQAQPLARLGRRDDARPHGLDDARAPSPPAARCWHRRRGSGRDCPRGRRARCRRAGSTAPPTASACG